ncbi:hypothetical protein C8F04DRAFT_1187289 [Mycena alexandri]|uniref:Uncharacterized protein n=1 Tax=Mycena alexandri TaxID=1745969 RepID=A0AAD6SP92_9AGAR|nr:hypothetical protein C8F04DRAFT_1187289 [Mycena alexandri]
MQRRSRYPHFARSNPALFFRPATRSKQSQPPPTSIHSLTPEEHLTCRREVNEANYEGTILTWSPTTNSVTPSVWHAPFRTTQNGQMTQFAASAYNNMPPSKLNAPHCPHAINGFNLAEETLMSAHFHKTRGWFFQARQHDCKFIVNIPPLGSRNIVHPDDLSEIPEDLNAGHFADSEDENESFEVMAMLDPKTAEKVSQIKKLVGHGSNFDNIPVNLYRHTPPRHRRSLPPPPRLPGPFLGPPMELSGHLCLGQRLTHGCVLIRSSETVSWTARVQAYMEDHPAWRSTTITECIPMLLPFHPLAPGAVMPPMRWMTRLGGQMLNQLNSTMGLPKVTLLRILLQSLECKGCGCCYSAEGYDHRRLNSQTDLPLIEEQQPELAGRDGRRHRLYGWDGARKQGAVPSRHGRVRIPFTGGNGRP